jgi:hypothetical protein
VTSAHWSTRDESEARVGARVGGEHAGMHGSGVGWTGPLVDWSR